MKRKCYNTFRLKLSSSFMTSPSLLTFLPHQCLQRLNKTVVSLPNSQRINKTSSYNVFWVSVLPQWLNVWSRSSRMRNCGISGSRISVPTLRSRPLERHTEDSKRLLRGNLPSQLVLVANCSLPCLDIGVILFNLKIKIW